MNESAERKLTAAEEIVRQLEVDDPMTDNVREYTTQWISAIIAASYERREPPAGPSCTVCGTAMQWECPKCGSTPQCTEAASVSEPAALFSISEASCIVHDIIEQYQSNLLGGECAAVLLRAIGLKRAASVSPAPKCSCLQFAVHLDCPLHGNLPLPESDQLDKNPLQPSPVGPEPAKEKA